ncbi:MAG: radical SAM protein [Candidatus Methanoperedens sp.]|nr:radical SAM protein [Candidatus Methanoperedens sp.]
MIKKEAKKIDVLFIIPPVLRFMNRSSTNFPLGLGYIAAYLKNKQNIHAEIYNADIYQSPTKMKTFLTSFYKLLKTKFLSYSDNVDFAEKWPEYYNIVNDIDNPIWDEVRSILKKANPKIVGIGSKVVDIPSTIVLAKIVKEVLPEAKVVVGGPSAITCSEYLMKNSPIDYLVTGEGEETMMELVSFIINNINNYQIQDIKGIIYRDESNKIIKNPPRLLIQNLDEIPFPERESMFIVEKNNDIKYIDAFGDILTTRGCPFPCRFCAAHEAWGTKKTRFRSIDNIIQELKYLVNTFGQKNFIFWDDLFTIDKNRTMELCQKIIDNKLDIRWLCLVRIDKIDAELLEKMKTAGCYEIQIGIESGNDRILSYIRKGINLEIIRKQISIIRQSGINWRIFLIIGFPTETREEIRDTINLIAEIKPTFVDLSIFCPYPGTDFYYDLQKQGQLDKDFMKSDMWYPYITYTGTMNNEEFKKIALEALKYVDKYNYNNAYKKIF